MTTSEFSESLIATFIKRRSQQLIELAEESIANGMDEFIEKGYITLNKGKFISYYQGDEFFDKAKQLGLNYYQYRTITDTVEANLLIHLQDEGWVMDWLNDQRVVMLPKIA